VNKKRQSGKNKSIYKQNVLAVFLYFIFSILLTFPLILNYKNKIIGNGGDVFQSLAEIINDFERLKALGHLQSIWDTVSNANLDPVTINTYFMFLFGQPAGYNIFWFFSFVASGFSVYLLTKYIFTQLKFTGARLQISAFIAGFIYAFSPAHFAWGGFRGATHIEWIPFTVLYIMKFIKKPSLKYLLSSGIFFVLLMQGEPHFAAFFFIFLIPFLIFYLYSNNRIMKTTFFRRYAIIGLALGILLLLWHYIPLINISTSEENYLNPGIEQTIRYSSDALSIITPPEFSTLFSKLFTPLRNLFTGNTAENSNYLGYTGLALFICSLIFYSKQKIKELYFWIISAIGFFVLSLGPFLHFGGTIEPKIPLPYLLIYKYVPFFDNIRSVGRLWAIALLCFSIAAAFGVQYVIANRKYIYQLLLGFLIIVMLSAEYLALPTTLSTLNYSPFYDQIKAEKGDFGVVDLPGSTNYLADGKTRYYASIYQKERISGLDPARKIEGNWDFQSTTPVLSEILYNLPNGKDIPRDIINHDYERLANSIFTYYHIPYLIIQKEFIGTGLDYIKPDSFNRLRAFIENNFDIENKYQDNYIYSYKIKQEIKPDSVYISIGDGWDDFNINDYNRKITDKADLQIFNLNDHETSLNIDLEINSYKNEYNLVEFYYNNQLVAKHFAYEDSTTTNIKLDNVVAGESTMEIRISNINEPYKDPRVYFKNIHYQIISEQVEMHSDFNYLDNDDTKAVLMLNPPIQSDSINTADNDGQKINNHPVISLQDFIEPDHNGNQKLFNTLPLINELFHIPYQNENKELLPFRDIREINYYKDCIARILHDKDIGYIYLDKNIVDEKIEDELSNYLEELIPSIQKIEGHDYIIYKINGVAINDSVPFVISGGWDILENKFGTNKRRKINDEAYLYLYSYEGKQINLTFDVRTCSNENTFAEIKINGKDDAKFTLNGTDYQTLSLTSLNSLENGINQMTITILDQGNNEQKICPIWVSNMKIYTKK
jgi:hypothetical protein